MFKISASIIPCQYVTTFHYAIYVYEFIEPNRIIQIIEFRNLKTTYIAARQWIEMLIIFFFTFDPPKGYNTTNIV